MEEGSESSCCSRTATEETDGRQPTLLGAHGARPCDGRAPNERLELPPPHDVIPLICITATRVSDLAKSAVRIGASQLGGLGEVTFGSRAASHVGFPDLQSASEAQIGRASCRERVE